MSSLRSSLPIFLITALSALPLDGSPFEEGDRWTMIGDSITHAGEYHTWVYLYCLTRFPEMELNVANAGNSGDDVHGALERYEWDIQPKNGSVASVMFGMNDVRREIYGDVADTNQIHDQRIYILEGYRSFMAKLVERLLADGARLILMTPTIYDETALHSRESLTGVNSALGECAAYVTQLAERCGATLVDFYGPMNELNARIQSKDPSASLIKEDRVHPNPMGQFIMAYLFLKAVGMPEIVSSVSIDASKAKVLSVNDASVESLVVDGDALSFSVKANAIPFPVGKPQQSALEWVPFYEDLNREILKVVGLDAGEYRLLIDGQEIRRYSAKELADGVNLALEANTPQAIQAAEVLQQMEVWHAKSLEYRFIANYEFWSLGDVEHPISIEDVSSDIKTEIERLAEFTSGPNTWKRERAIRYLNLKPQDSKIMAEMQEMIERIRATVRPRLHDYRLERMR